MREWHYTKMGLQQGPVPEDELRQKIRRGEVGETTLVWCEGMMDWLPLSQVPELQRTQPADPPGQAQQLPSAAPQPANQTLGHIPLPQPPAYEGDYIAPMIPNHMWQSVVATVIGLPFCCILAMPFGIVAIVFASRVEGMRVQGDISGAWAASNSARTWMIASYVCSAIGLALNIFSVISSRL